MSNPNFQSKVAQILFTYHLNTMQGREDAIAAITEAVLELPAMQKTEVPENQSRHLWGDYDAEIEAMKEAIGGNAKIDELREQITGGQE